MAVCADHAVARAHEPLFGQQGVFDAHFAHVVKVRHLLFLRKFARLFHLAGGLDVLIGGKVIHYERHFVAAFHAAARLFHLVDGDGGGDVVGKRKIELRFDELARFHAREPRVCGKDLLCHRHSHSVYLLSAFDKIIAYMLYFRQSFKKQIIKSE